MLITGKAFINPHTSSVSGGIESGFIDFRSTQTNITLLEMQKLRLVYFPSL